MRIASKLSDGGLVWAVIKVTARPPPRPATAAATNGTKGKGPCRVRARAAAQLLLSCCKYMTFVHCMQWCSSVGSGAQRCVGHLDCSLVLRFSFRLIEI